MTAALTHVPVLAGQLPAEPTVDLGHQAGPLVILSAWSAEDRWWLVVRIADDGPWRRFRLAAWALVDDQGDRWVCGLEAAGDQLELARSGPGAHYRHDDTWPRCGCDEPAVEPLDVGWCTSCCGLVMTDG